MKQTFVTTVIVVSVLLGAVAFAQPRPSPEYIVIVHPSNPASTVTRTFLADAFLKRVTRWPDGESIRPVDLSGDSPVRRRFVEDVLGRSIVAIRSYWQQIIFTGRGVPPVEFGNDVAVVAYVQSHRGAVGYVSSAAEVGGAKVITVQ